MPPQRMRVKSQQINVYDYDDSKPRRQQATASDFTVIAKLEKWFTIVPKCDIKRAMIAHCA